jgi:regulator of protease activity HflC (stomatin/prohibitin superfamily)
MTFLYLVIAALLVAGVLYRMLVRIVVVREGLAGLLYIDGRLVKTLQPGRHRLHRRRTEVVTIDLRERLLTVVGQELTSRDQVNVRLNLAVTFAVEVPELATTFAQDFTQSLYLDAQLALRRAVAARTVEELLEERDGLGRDLTAELASEASRLGLQLRRAELKDVILPAGLKQAFADALKARKEGAAALERARAESAALRNLANAARLLEGNPELYQLRLLQAFGQGGGGGAGDKGGHRLVLKVKSGS